MYERYRNDVAFFVVYIGEAHPSDAWQLPSNIRDKVVYASPANADERTELGSRTPPASSCRSTLEPVR